MLYDRRVASSCADRWPSRYGKVAFWALEPGFGILWEESVLSWRGDQSCTTTTSVGTEQAPAGTGRDTLHSGKGR
jgi:hypothetical protein